jgi:carbonic anhydrase
MFLEPKKSFSIKHIRCGLLGVPEEVVHGIMTKNLGLTESKDVDDFGVMIFLELGESTREEVEGLRSHPVAWKKVRVTGRIHDTDTELLRKIVE